MPSGEDLLLYFVAFFIPPLPVFLKKGLKADFWINIVLWILGWIPGVVHAWYVIATNPAHKVAVAGGANPVGVQQPGASQYPGASQFPSAAPAQRTAY